MHTIHRLKLILPILVAILAASLFTLCRGFAQSAPTASDMISTFKQAAWIKKLDLDVSTFSVLARGTPLIITRHDEIPSGTEIYPVVLKLKGDFGKAMLYRQVVTMSYGGNTFEEQEIWRSLKVDEAVVQLVFYQDSYRNWESATPGEVGLPASEKYSEMSNNLIASVSKEIWEKQDLKKQADEKKQEQERQATQEIERKKQEEASRIKGVFGVLLGETVGDASTFSNLSGQERAAMTEALGKKYKKGSKEYNINFATSQRLQNRIAPVLFKPRTPYSPFEYCAVFLTPKSKRVFAIEGLATYWIWNGATPEQDSRNGARVILEQLEKNEGRPLSKTYFEYYERNNWDRIRTSDFFRLWKRDNKTSSIGDVCYADYNYENRSLVVQREYFGYSKGRPHTILHIIYSDSEFEKQALNELE